MYCECSTKPLVTASVKEEEGIGILKKVLTRNLMLLVFLIVFCNLLGYAEAALIDRGNGLIYDSDLNITWMQDLDFAHKSGFHPSTWDPAEAWVADLVYAGYDNWRQPTVSELQHLYMEELGNSPEVVTWDPNTGEPTFSGGLVNYFPFLSLEYLGDCCGYNFWTSEGAPGGDAWYFAFMIGRAITITTYLNAINIWPVRDGDVESNTPPTNDDGLLNIAPIYGIASADSTWPERPTSRAIDGIIAGQSQWSAGDYGTPSNPHWLIVDLQNEYPISQITVCGFPYVEGDYYWGYTNIYNLYTSTNGADWVLIGSDSWAEVWDPSIYSDTFVLNEKPLLRYVKYEVVGGSHWAGLQELMIFTGNDVPAQDTVPPEISIISPTQYGLYPLGSLILNFEATDSGTGVLECGGTLTDSHGYSAEVNSGFMPGAGVYTLMVSASDKAGNEAVSEPISFVVYDPEGGFVTGGGWIWSPIGAYVADTALEGKANFGFVSKYKKGATVPTGQTEFVFQAGDLNFHSSSYEWLVVTGSNYARFKGSGTINGLGDYNFMLWAGDNEQDTFRIKIWWETGDTENVVYDNGKDQTIEGGSIIVHTR